MSSGNSREWNELGFWEWSCGCAQFQDGWEKCRDHTGRLIASDPSIQERVVDNPPSTEVYDKFTRYGFKLLSSKQLIPPIKYESEVVDNPGPTMYIVNDGGPPVVFSNQYPHGKVTLPTDPQERKRLPIWTGVMLYFPLALAEIARVSLAGNDQHNPNEPLHWAKEKSTDHLNTAIRHLLDYGMDNPIDTDGTCHLAKACWRLLAELETSLEKELKD